MGVDINVYRIRIGLFSMPRKCRFKLDTLCFARATVSNVLRLTLFISILLALGGDVETNPGPTRPQRQKTLSFAESLASPSSSLSNSPTASNRKQTNVQREQDNEIMSFLRELKDEVKADLKTLNDKMGGVESSISALRDENEKLRIENREIKDELSKLYTKMDTLESHSRRNNLRIYGIRSELNDTWEVTEQRVRNFIKDELDMQDQEHVEIERAHKLGSKHSDRSPIIVKFGRYKDKDMILNRARQRFERDSPFSVKRILRSAF